MTSGGSWRRTSGPTRASTSTGCARYSARTCASRCRRSRGVWVGRDETIKGWVDGGFGQGDYADWTCRTTMANGQPAVAMYLRRSGASTYKAFSMDVLRIEGGLIAEIITFDSEVFDWFRLPRQLEAG